MNVIIQPSVVTGNILAPVSKSAMQRACALALLHKGETVIQNPGKSNDDIAAINIIKNLGAHVKYWNDGSLHITSNFPENKLLNNELYCGESGLSLRMFTPVAALYNAEIIITGSGSLLNRPVNFFDKTLPEVGVEISSSKGKLPLRIKGPLLPENITVDGSLSSQFLTGLLIAFAVSSKEVVTINVTALASRPYIDLTLQMMQHFGWNIENKDYTQFIIYPIVKSQSPTVNYKVESDWSNGAFLLVAGAIAGKDLCIRGLDYNSPQGDKKIMEALKLAGCGFEITNEGISVSKSNLMAFEFDATNCPDLFPPLVALAAYCKGRSFIKGVHRLRHKESDRAQTLQSEFYKMGVEINISMDIMEVTGTSEIKSAAVDSHNDHRIAMACAVAGCGASGNIIIQTAEAVNKSYPDFFEDLQMLNVSLQKT